MQEFTPMDYFWILLTIALICTIVGIIFRSILKVALTIALLFLIASIGFGFIPEQIGKIQNGETTSSEVINELGNSIGNKVEEGVQYIEDIELPRPRGAGILLSAMQIEELPILPSTGWTYVLPNQ